MLRRIVLAWVLVSMGGLSARAQVPYPRDLIPTRTALGRIGLENAWFTAVPLIETERLLGIDIADNLLFAQTSSSTIYTYDAETGQFLWSTSLGHRTNEAREVATNSRMVFVTSSTFLFALDRRTGRTIWKVELPGQPSSPTGADEDRAMIGLASGKLMAFDVENGSPLWNWQTGGPILARPIPAIQLAAFASRDGKAYVSLVDPITMLYRFATGGPISASMGTFGTRTLLIPSEDRNLYAVDLFTAEAKWTFPSGAPILQEPLVANGDVYVANAQGRMSALEAESGKPRWTTSTHGGQLLAVGAKRIYLNSSDGDLFIVDRATGQMVADPRATKDRSGVNLREFDLNVTNSLNDRLYFATSSGLALAVREIGAVRPQPLRDPNAPPFGFIPTEEESDTPPAPTDTDAAPADENAPPAGDADFPQ